MEQLVRLEFPNLWLVLPELIVLLTGFILFSLDLIYKRINQSPILFMMAGFIYNRLHSFNMQALKGSIKF